MVLYLSLDYGLEDHIAFSEHFKKGSGDMIKMPSGPMIQTMLQYFKMLDIKAVGTTQPPGLDVVEDIESELTDYMPFRQLAGTQCTMQNSVQKGSSYAANYFGPLYL